MTWAWHNFSLSLFLISVAALIIFIYIYRYLLVYWIQYIYELGKIISAGINLIRNTKYMISWQYDAVHDNNIYSWQNYSTTDTLNLMYSAWKNNFKAFLTLFRGGGKNTCAPLFHQITVGRQQYITTLMVCNFNLVY